MHLIGLYHLCVCIHIDKDIHIRTYVYIYISTYEYVYPHVQYIISRYMHMYVYLYADIHTSRGSGCNSEYSELLRNEVVSKIGPGYSSFKISDGIGYNVYIHS